MSTNFVVDTADKTRRELLIRVNDLFDNPSELKKLAGSNALLDCALVLFAEGDELRTSVLNTVLDVEQLREDIAHVRRSAEIRAKRREMLR